MKPGRSQRQLLQTNSLCLHHGCFVSSAKMAVIVYGDQLAPAFSPDRIRRKSVFFAQVPPQRLSPNSPRLPPWPIKPAFRRRCHRGTKGGDPDQDDFGERLASIHAFSAVLKSRGLHLRLTYAEAQRAWTPLIVTFHPAIPTEYQTCCRIWRRITSTCHSSPGAAPLHTGDQPGRGIFPAPGTFMWRIPNLMPFSGSLTAL